MFLGGLSFFSVVQESVYKKGIFTVYQNRKNATSESSVHNPMVRHSSHVFLSVLLPMLNVELMTNLQLK